MEYRVLHCLHSMNRGGAETFIMNVFRTIDKSVYMFDFLLGREDGAYVEEIRKLGGGIYTVCSRSAGYFKYLKALNSFFKTNRGKYQAIHVHTSSLSSLEVFYFAKKYGIKTRIIHSHSTVQAGWVHNILHWLHKPILGFLANKYLACSLVAKDWLYKYTCVYDKSVVVKNGVDITLFSFNVNNRNEIRRELGIDNQCKVIGHIGRFDVMKNHTYLLDIFKELQRIDHNTVLLLVGDGPLRKNIENKTMELGLNNKVIFTGVRSDIYKIVSAIDILVFPSLYEGLPVSLVEAQAGGLTIVCSDRVSKEVQLSEAVSFLSLDKPACFWANYIDKLKVEDRNEVRESVIRNGYSVNNTVDYLVNNVYE